jgi:hypothetical protein
MIFVLSSDPLVISGGGKVQEQILMTIIIDFRAMHQHSKLNLSNSYTLDIMPCCLYTATQERLARGESISGFSALGSEQVDLEINNRLGGDPGQKAEFLTSVLSQ